MPHNAPATSYDDVPYPALCYTQSHPDRLATCARLLGVESAPVERCRVLEVGCASGGGFLLPLLDGRRTRDDLARILDDLVAAGRLKVTGDATGEADPAASLDRVHRELDASLAWLARASLLVG